MQNGQNSNTRHRRPASPNRPNQWRSNGARPESKNPQNAQRNYERYLALAQAEAQAGDRVAAENYYQYAEHYLRSMSSDRGTT